MSNTREYEDIPGTFVMDGRHTRAGYHLNMFCMSLNKPENREAFKANEESYLDQYPMTPEQRDAVLKRDWMRMMQLGGNIFYIYKLGILDGKTLQYIDAQMSGVTEEEFKTMLANGGRPIEGNRSKKEQKIG